MTTYHVTCVVLTNFVVHTAFHLPHGGPALLFLHLWVVVQDLVPQPGQVVHTHLVLLTGGGGGGGGERVRRREIGSERGIKSEKETERARE